MIFNGQVGKPACTAVFEALVPSRPVLSQNYLLFMLTMFGDPFTLEAFLTNSIKHS